MTVMNKANTRIISTQFNYHQPETLEEAVTLLKELSNVKPMAGGTDLIPKMKQRLLEPANIVNLKKIPELNAIRVKDNTVFIGAVAKLRDIERNNIVQERLPLLYDCIKSIGSIQIRNMGTLGGNVCNASPAADGALGLVTLDSIAQIQGPEGTREEMCIDFFTGPGSTTLKKGELLKGFKIPIPNKDAGSCFISIGRTSLDISTISIAVMLEKEDEKIEEIKIGLGSVAPTPLRVYEVERWLSGKKMSSGNVMKAAKMVQSSIKPITDIRGTAEYRRAAAEGLTREAITRAWRSGGGDL